MEESFLTTETRQTAGKKIRQGNTVHARQIIGCSDGETCRSISGTGRRTCLLHGIPDVQIIIERKRQVVHEHTVDVCFS
jgi:hypothetical protein